MCCWTHQDLRYPGPIASETVDDRCRCECRPECRRRATAEDIRCDICGGRASSDPAQLEQQDDPRLIPRYVDVTEAMPGYPIVIEPWRGSVSPPGVPPGMPAPGA
jgi:hypothetical protein